MVWLDDVVGVLIVRRGVDLRQEEEDGVNAKTGTSRVGGPKVRDLS